MSFSREDQPSKSANRTESRRAKLDRKAKENARHQIAFRSCLEQLNALVDKYEGKQAKKRTKLQLLNKVIMIMTKKEQ